MSPEMRVIRFTRDGEIRCLRKRGEQGTGGLIRLLLSFALSVPLKGQAETFVFHYIVPSKIEGDGDRMRVCGEGKVQ